jgi:ankyrin repeat protein
MRLFVVLLCVVISSAFAQSTFVEDLLFSDANAVREWLESGVDVNASIPEFGNSLPLELAATYNTDASVVELLLRAGAKVNAVSEYGATALQGAVSWNPNPEVTRLLLAAGADLYVNGNSVLVEAARQNSPEIVRLLVEAGANVNEPVGEEFPLFAALQQNCFDTVETLLELGADASLVSTSGRSALHRILLRTEEVVRYARANQLKGEGVKPCQDHLTLEEQMKVLITAGADPNARTLDGLTPLMFAAAVRKLEMVSVLLEADADVNARSENGVTALLQVLRRESVPAAFHPAPSSEVLRLLITYGADVNVSCQRQNCGGNLSVGETALLLAVRSRDAESVRLLLEAGANTEVSDARGRTALLWAGIREDGCSREYASPEIIRLLVEAGADVNVQATYKGSEAMFVCEDLKHLSDTPLLQAVRRSDVETVKLLVEHGAELSLKNDDGWTALDFAVQTQQEEIVEVLLEASQQ